MYRSLCNPVQNRVMHRPSLREESAFAHTVPAATASTASLIFLLHRTSVRVRHPHQPLKPCLACTIHLLFVLFFFVIFASPSASSSSQQNQIFREFCPTFQNERFFLASFSSSSSLLFLLELCVIVASFDDDPVVQNLLVVVVKTQTLLSLVKGVGGVVLLAFLLPCLHQKCVQISLFPGM